MLKFIFIKVLVPIMFMAQMIMAAFILPDYPRATYNVAIAIVFLLFSIHSELEDAKEKSIVIQIPKESIDEIIKLNCIDYANWIKQNNLEDKSDEELYQLYTNQNQA